MSARDLEGDATMETTVPNLQLSRHLQNCQQCLKCKVAFAPLKLSAVQISFSRWCYPEEEVGYVYMVRSKKIMKTTVQCSTRLAAPYSH